MLTKQFRSLLEVQQISSSKRVKYTLDLRYIVVPHSSLRKIVVRHSSLRNIVLPHSSFKDESSTVEGNHRTRRLSIAFQPADKLWFLRQSRDRSWWRYMRLSFLPQWKLSTFPVSFKLPSQFHSCFLEKPFLRSHIYIYRNTAAVTSPHAL